MIKWINLFFLVIVLASCADSDDPNAQIKKEIAAIDEYLSLTNSDYVAYDGNGTRMVIEEFGEGAPPHTGQTVVAQYSAELFPEGTIIGGGTINQKIDDVEGAGLQRGLASLLKGTYATLYVPSDNAYGKTGTDVVPPNKTIVYRVYLSDVIRTADEQVQFAKDTATIHKYIIDQKISNAKLHPSGIWYTLNAVGTGDYAKTYDFATFDYKGIVLSNGSIFDQGSLSSQSIFGLIDGLKIGIPVMNEGGSATFYLPSGYCYGTQSSGSIPANANLIFEIKLNTVFNNN